MPHFSYTVRSAEGEIASGTMEALSLQAAREALTKQGIDVEEIHEVPERSLPRTEHTMFFPLLDTLRLYAGWLLAWYLLVFALGMFQEERMIHFSLPLVSELYRSLVTLRVACAMFLFLLLSEIHRVLHGRALSGLLLTLLWIILVTLFTLNT